MSCQLTQYLDFLQLQAPESEEESEEEVSSQLDSSATQSSSGPEPVTEQPPTRQEGAAAAKVCTYARWQPSVHVSVVIRKDHSPKGLMVPLSRKDTQGPRRRFHTVVNLYGSALGFSERTNHSPCGCVASTECLQFLGDARQALGGGRKEGPQGGKGSVTPLRCVNAAP